MPKCQLEAAAEGMPAISRRAALMGLAASSAAVLPAAAAPANDPLFAAILDYRAGNAAFEALPIAETQEDENAQVRATYGPPMQRLNSWSAPATSLRGVAEAIRIVLDEDDFGCFLSRPVLSAALAYLDEVA